MVVVLPIGGGGHTHQDGFGSAVGFEAKLGAAVPYQIKLHVAASAEVLPFLLFGAVGAVGASAKEFEVGGCEEIAGGEDKLQEPVFG